MRVVVPAILGLLLLSAPDHTTAQGFPPPIPPPVQQPAYAAVTAIVERLDGLDSEVALRLDELWKGQGMFFLTRQERTDYFVARKQALDTTRARQREVREELVKVALPKLGQDCRVSGNAACVEWVRRQRLWREELWSLRDGILNCSEDRSRVAIQQRADSFSSGSPSYEQYSRDQALARKQQAELAAIETSCIADHRRHIEALNIAIAGRDPLAEMRAGPKGLASGDYAADTEALFLRVQSITANLDARGVYPTLPPDLVMFEEQFRQFKWRYGEVPSSANDVVRKSVEAGRLLVAGADAWRREQQSARQADDFESQRVAAEAELAKTPSEAKRYAATVARASVTKATRARDEAAETKVSSWESAKRLVDEATALAGKPAK